jgi:hydrogenase nickel incorporation protein HypA/HybF
MHEVALAQGILEVVLDIANGESVRTVRVRAGEQQAVAEESLQFCFEMVALDTSAASAQLEVQIVPGDVLLVDAIELSSSGWHIRPDTEDPTLTPGVAG